MNQENRAPAPRREDLPAPTLPPLPGLVVVDKPQGWTSHDVVARVRRLAGTRKVGHAGTLDPMATGVLVLGIEKATKLLTWVSGVDKTYEATILLGRTTVTDDAEGESTGLAPAERVQALTSEQVLAEVARLTGKIQQVPSAVSAIKVDGKRSYARVRSGEEVALAARPVTVSEFTVHEQGLVQESDGTVLYRVEATVTCSSGTYVRALARDLGEALGTGGHLTALRRTRVGGVGLDEAHTLEELGSLVAGQGRLPVTSMEQAAAGLFPVRQLTAAEAADLAHGRRIAPSEPVETPAAHDDLGLTAAMAPDGRLVALVANRGRGEKAHARPHLVLRAGEEFDTTGQETLP